MKTLIPSLEDYIYSVISYVTISSFIIIIYLYSLWGYLYNKNLFGVRCVVFRLRIIGMMKRILGSMIRMIGKNSENTRIIG